MTNPLISICIPVYNGEKYLKKCLDSCITQSFKEYEIVICDDGSTDASQLIIEEYANMIKQIRFYKNEKNMGLVGNWNKCLDLAKGEWIKFMFQDDSMQSNCLQKFMEQIDPSVKLLVCKRNFLIDKIATDDEKDYYQNRVRTLENTGNFYSNKFDAKTISEIYIRNISMNFIAEPSLTFFRKDLTKEMGEFDGELKQICDLEFLLRIASNYGLKYIPEQLCSFRIHSSSTTEKNVTTNNYGIMNLEGLLYALKVLTKKEFEKLRTHIGYFGIMRLKIYIKYRFYKAFVAIKTEQDGELFNSLKSNYESYSFKTYEIPFLKLIIKFR